MHYEILFARFQMDKLLDTMGMKYMDIFSKNNYKEETNAFAYIILTYLLLYKYDIFIEWCNKYNPTLLRVGNNSISELIKPYPIPDINLNKPKYSNYMKENSRMTSIELE
jgi:hypothetical protein